MNFRFTIVETSLNRAEFRWKWLKLLRYSFLLGAVFWLICLSAEAAILRGWLVSKALVTFILASSAVIGFLAWVVILISVLAGTTDRNWLAAALERVDRRLMDRLNTLLFLESHRGDAQTESFALRIARQTQGVLAEKPSHAPFASARPWPHLLAFMVLLGATVVLFQHYSPWDHLLAADKTRKILRPGPDKPLDLALPATNSVEQERIWGEVRITDPGADLKVTKLDVVPLQIEAAASQPLEKVAWYSTINGAQEATHELAAPTEPRYAVYQPELYLDELRLGDWDVVTYYAKANTEQANSYASEVYFLEVRPFREDILKLPGGAMGKAHQCLNEMSMLVSRQQHVIRQTHQHLQKPPETENLRDQDRKKLSEAEADLSDSTEHLYAKMAATMENKPIGDALDNLAKAQQSLDNASDRLHANVLNEAQSKERSALAELVAARKIFQKKVTENPGAFEEPNTEEPPPPVADASTRLQKMTEFRNETKAAQQFVNQTLEQQKNLEKEVKSVPRNDLPRLAEQEKLMEQALQDFQQQHPKPFAGVQSESQEAEQALTNAAASLQKRSPEAQPAMKQATERLEQLSQAMTKRSAEQQLADAYRLKQILDQEIQTFGKCSNPGANVSDADLQTTASQARETVNRLKALAEQEPTRDAFGQPLRDALSGENKVDLDARLNRVQQAQEQPEKQQRAGEAKDALSRVSQAFDQSQPKAMQIARQTDSLKPSPQDSFNLGMSELQSLLRQLEQSHKLSQEDSARQGHEALYNLQSGLRSQFGDNERGDQILLRLEQILKGETPLEVADLKKLMDELQHFSVETSDRLAKKEAQPEVTNIDPSKLPPAYRGRIQKYFQKLSEK